MNSYAPAKSRSIFILYPKNLIYPLSKTFILSFLKVFCIWNKIEPHRPCDASLCFSGLCGAHAGRTARCAPTHGTEAWAPNLGSLLNPLAA